MLDVTAGQFTHRSISELSTDYRTENGIKGLPQFIHITFSDPVVPKILQVTFQGGFVGKCCRLSTLAAVLVDEKGAALSELATVYPEDVNRKQTFKLPETEPIIQMRLSFEESSDFFGRITVYDLQIEGLLNPNNPA